MRWAAQWGGEMVAAARRQIAARPALDLSFASDDEAQSFAAASGGSSLAPRMVRIDSSKIEDLRRPEFKVATLTYTIEGQDLFATPLELDSANVRFTAKGVCHLPGTTLDLQARLVLGGPLAKQLPAFIATNFESSTDTPGEKFIDFKIGGTISNPSTDLFQKTLSQPVQSLLGRVLGRNRKPEESPAVPDTEPSPSVSPAGSPPP